MLDKNFRPFPGRWIGLISAFILIATVARTTDAQQTRGSISGILTDTENAAVSGAEITVINKGTNYQRKTTSNDKGFYRINALEPGTYSITVVKSGLTTTTGDDITINTSNEVTRDLMLGLKRFFDTVNVIATPATEISKNPLSGTQVTLTGEELDLSNVTIGRDASRAAYLAPGVVRCAGPNEACGAGSRSRAGISIIDGVENFDRVVTITSAQPPPEDIKEIRIEVVHPDATAGGNTGPRVNIVTKSGSNSLHGELWNYYRGNALEPLSLANRRAGVKKCSDVSPGTECGTPMFSQNQFGFDAGGPLIRNKTFFFGMFQSNLKRSAPSAVSGSAATIPTAAGYAALLTAPLRPGGTQSQASRDAMLQSISFLPEIQSGILNYTTTKTVSVNTIPIEVGTFIPLVSQPQNLYYNSVRLDHVVSPTDTLYYRYVVDFRNRYLIGDNLAFGKKWGDDEFTHAQNHALSNTKVIGSSFVNETQFAYARRLFDSRERDPLSPTVNITSLFTIGGLAGFPQNRVDQSYQFQNTSHYIRGRHSLKFGFDLHQEYLLNDFESNSKGTWTFSSLENFMNNTGTLSQSLTQGGLFNLHQLNQAYFAQDDIKLARSFSASIGMRYETASIPLGMFGATDPLIQAAGVPGPVKRDTNNWGPRLGFAYSPQSSSGILGKIFGQERSSIRAGFGMNYDILFYNIIATTATNYPRSLTTATTTTLTDIYPTLQFQSGSLPAFDPKSSFANVPPDSQNPTTNFWSLIFQRQFGENSNYLLEIGYSGNRSYHEIRQSQANPGILSDAKAQAVIAGCTIPGASLTTCVNPAPFNASPDRLVPAWGSRTTVETTGKGQYNGVYIQFDKRLGRLTIGGNYSFSRTKSDSEEAFNDATSSNSIASSSPQVPQDFLNYRGEWSRSVFDRPHRVSVHYIYALPWFKSSPSLLKKAFSGWQVSGYTDAQSGQPFTIRLGVDALGSGSATGARPNLNPGGILLSDPVTGNLRTFTIPKDGTGIVSAPYAVSSSGVVSMIANSMPHGGNLPRNYFRGPGFQNWNVSLLKKIPILDRREIVLRGDFVNLFNHDNYLNPDPVMNSATFGASVYANGPGMLTDARQILLSFKFRF